MTVEVNRLRMKLKTLSIPEDLHTNLRIHAAHTGQAIGDVAAKALRYWLRVDVQPKPKKNGKR